MMTQKCNHLRNAIGLFGVAVSLLSLSACTSLNESVSMHGSDGNAVLVSTYDDSTQPIASSGSPSLTGGIDRSHWETVAVPMVYRDTETRPNYGKAWLYPSCDNARAAGHWPTLESSLQITNRTRDIQGQYLEMFYEPIHQWVNTGLIPIRIITKEPPRTILHGPIYGYELQPTDETPISLTE